MKNDVEYKIITGTTSECQKTLNQWKHEYFLSIIGFTSSGNSIAILLTRSRTRKSKTTGEIERADET